MECLDTAPLENPMQFALAGNARFTLVSKSTQARFTFKVKQSEDNATMHFVSVLTGPDNWSNYSYLGFHPPWRVLPRWPKGQDCIHGPERQGVRLVLAQRRE